MPTRQNGTSMPAKSSRFLDLNAAIDSFEPLQFEWGDPPRIYALPGDPPARDLLRYEELQASGQANSRDLLGALIGADLLAELLDAGLSGQGLNTLVMWATEQYRLARGGADDGEAADPWSASPTSSNAGTPSRPTSPVTTESIL